MGRLEFIILIEGQNHCVTGLDSQDLQLWIPGSASTFAWCPSELG